MDASISPNENMAIISNFNFASNGDYLLRLFANAYWLKQIFQMHFRVYFFTKLYEIWMQDYSGENESNNAYNFSVSV